jgi:hypothetical protein
MLPRRRPARFEDPVRATSRFDLRDSTAPSAHPHHNRLRYPSGKSRHQPVQSIAQKYSASRIPQIRTITPAVLSLTRGVGHRHERGVGCGGRGSVGCERDCRAGLAPVSDHRAPDERRLNPAKPSGEDGWLRTAKPCGSGTRCWCQVGGGDVNPTGRDKTFNPPMTVTRGIRRRGEHGISRKAIARGMPECFR